MKKIYTLITASCLLTAYAVNSQPTLTAANSNPVAGDTYGYHSTSLTSPAPITNAGAGIIWDITAYSTPLTNYDTYVNASSTPYASTFPAANLAVDEGSGNYSYYLTSSSEYSYYGSASGSLIVLYSNSMKQMSYPFSYNSTFNDNFYATTPPVAPVSFIYGTNFTVADGYGSIIMPYGTLTNVLRTHSTINQTDSSSGNVSNLIYHLYSWFLPGTHAPVCSYISIPLLSSYAIGYLDQNSLGIEDNNSGNSFFSVSPNPANEFIVISYPLIGNEKINLTITDVTGKKVYQTQLETSNLKLRTSNFANGIYFVEINNGKEKAVKKFVKN